MNLPLRRAIVKHLKQLPDTSRLFSELSFDEDEGSGSINYARNYLWVDPAAPGFNGHKTLLSDEELVRAYLLASLLFHDGYDNVRNPIEIERVYRPVGRPTGKGGRVDVLVRGNASDRDASDPFLFIECKAPSKFDSDKHFIDGQLFRLSMQESPRPRYLVYYTVELRVDLLAERLILIDTTAFANFDLWDKAGQPITAEMPQRFGTAQKSRYGNVTSTVGGLIPLDRIASREQFAGLQTELHDVIWGGGGTNNNEVFVYITKLILSKIYDEKESLPGTAYQFQRLGDANRPETPTALLERMNRLYSDAESAYLALTSPSSGPAFDANRISPEKIAFVVGRLEGLSISENLREADLLGEFFEHIVSEGFTQTKGQFFTPSKLVRFMLQLSNVAENASTTMRIHRDHLGRPRLPYVIDPSCGSGTFLIEYMNEIRINLGTDQVRASLPDRIKEQHRIWFSGTNGNAWARDFMFGIENNYDLALAAKVNMVLHGDGSMNTYSRNALLPFERYWMDGRNNILGIGRAAGSAYTSPVNEQFDLILSNPPFSIKLSADEKQEIQRAFGPLAESISESIFVERWYQLLREGGRFCCVLPEAILDTATNETVRLFLIKHFKISAIISLPYDAFKPFTSTKTCVVLAEKRSTEDVARFAEAWATASLELAGLENNTVLARTLENLGWLSEEIFLAEPESIGYKRRKNLSDLETRNDLYSEDGAADSERDTVLARWMWPQDSDSALGFRVTLREVAGRTGLRLDPKYRWLWDFQGGTALGSRDDAVPLATILQLVQLSKVAKGDLEDDATLLLDLDSVETRLAFVREDAPRVGVINSDKLFFEGCEMAMSRLEPYLGKLIIDPPGSAIGSTEWFGLRRLSEDIPLLSIAYMLLLPEMLETYRRLQSGKRHARLDPRELLDIRVVLPIGLEEIARQVGVSRLRILELREEERRVRASVDTLFRS